VVEDFFLKDRGFIDDGLKKEKKVCRCWNWPSKL